MDIVSAAMDDIDDAAVDGIARALGVDSEGARAGVAVALPALLAMLSGKGSTATGAGAVFDAVRGGRAIEPLLGEEEAAMVVRAVGECAGLDGRRSADLLGRLGPVALGAIGREMAARELDKTRLARFLSARRAVVDEALPPGFAEHMRGSRHFDAFRTGFAADATVPMTVTTTPDPAVLAKADYARTVRRPTAMRWGIAAVLVLLAAAWLLYAAGTRPPVPSPSEVIVRDAT